MRMHRMKQRKWVKAWFWILYEAILHAKDNGGTVARAKKTRAVKVTRYRKGGGPLQDESNLVLATDKLIYDNLIKLGVLVDDNRKWLKSLGIHEKRAKRNRTVIEIREG